MKKIIASFALFSMFVSCTKDLGTLKNISTRDFNPDRNYELAIKQQPFTANSIEACVNLALKAVPNASFLKNTNITSKGKKVTIVTDIWSMTKEKPKKPKESKKPKKNKNLKLDKFKNPRAKGAKNKPTGFNIKDFKEGMQVSWEHPKFGFGTGMIVGISGGTAMLDKVQDKYGKLLKPIELPIEILRPEKRRK
jgi:hypothetical protein